jgi:hypothetical protein
MREICNLVYFILSDGKTTAQKAELDVLLTDPAEKEKMIARQNAEAMKALGGMGMLMPPPARPKKAE